LVTGNQH
jgi:hypothetical protein